MGYQMAATAVTLNDIHWLQAFSYAIRRTFVQHFTRFRYATSRSGISSADELLYYPALVLSTRQNLVTQIWGCTHPQISENFCFRAYTTLTLTAFQTSALRRRSSDSSPLN